MDKTIKGVLIWFVVGFIVGLIFTKDIKTSFTTGIIVIILFFLIKSGALKHLFSNIGGEVKKFDDRTKKHDKKVADWKNHLHQIRMEKAAAEIGLREGRRLDEQIRERKIKEERRRRAFMSNPLGIGR